jgi:hypothetical protein
MYNGNVKTEVPPATLATSITAESLVTLSVNERIKEHGLPQSSNTTSMRHLSASMSTSDPPSLISGKREGGATPALQAGGMKVGQLTAQV